jgi:hypothetical protein
LNLIDLVNFNADGSCLEAEVWLRALEGGRRSRVCRWLNLYVEQARRVSLGWTGATVADLSRRNPEALDCVNAHPGIFEILLRPFAHDVALLRSPRGFERNISLGLATLRREFHSITPYYLPPEFMLTATGIHQLVALGVEGVFINAERFESQLRERIPAVPYRVRGAMGSSLVCVPIRGELTSAWLESMHEFDARAWNRALSARGESTAVAWRDGETFLFMPEGLERERAWLEGESGEVGRRHVSEIFAAGRVALGEIPTGALGAYPPHSFTEWFRESRMLGFLHRLEAVERRLDSFTTEELTLWLQAINSDVLSAVEKESPVIELRRSRETGERTVLSLLRSERGFEGEEFLALLERWRDAPDAAAWIEEASDPHVVKLRARLAYLREVLER